MNEINYEIIQQYINGELSNDEVVAFEAAIRANPILAEEVKLYKTIDREMQEQVVGKANATDVQTSLQELTNEFFSTPKAKVISVKKYWWAVGAAAAAVLLFFLLRPAFNTRFDNAKLYAAYTKDVKELSTEVRGGNTDSLLSAAAKLYNTKNFKAAIPLLKEVVDKVPESKEFYIAAGYCYMQIENTDSAILIFDEIIKTTSIYKSRAQWYKALALLKQNKIDSCYADLKLIPEGADNYKAARELMKKIEKR